jgi:hypothetical protein
MPGQGRMYTEQACTRQQCAGWIAARSRTFQCRLDQLHYVFEALENTIQLHVCS